MLIGEKVLLESGEYLISRSDMKFSVKKLGRGLPSPVAMTEELEKSLYCISVKSFFNDQVTKLATITVDNDQTITAFTTR